MNTCESGAVVGNHGGGFEPSGCDVTRFVLVFLFSVLVAGCSDEPTDVVEVVEPDATPIRQLNGDAGDQGTTADSVGDGSGDISADSVQTDPDGSNSDTFVPPDSSVETADCGSPSGGLLISEIVDPNIDLPSRGRYVELYNAGNVSVDLTGWRLVRHFDTDGTMEADLPSVSVAPCQTFVIARDGAGFALVYGMSPDWEPANGATGSALDHNGDDAIALVNGSVVVDQFGIPAESSGDPTWAYDDSVVNRNPSITTPSPTYQSSQWTVTLIPETTLGTATPGVR